MSEVKAILQRCQKELLALYRPQNPYYIPLHNTSSPFGLSTFNDSYSAEDEWLAWGGTDAPPSEWGSNWLEEVTEAPSYNFTVLVLCDHCNFTDDEHDILFESGVCVPSDFSSYMPLIYIMYTLIFLVALFGNALVLHTIAANRKMHTVTNLFIANLAVGDLLIMVLCVPFSVASIIVLQYWPFGEGLCVFVNYSQAVSIFVSAYTLVAISVDRYLAIIYPLRPRMTRCQAKCIIAGVWSLALFTTLPIAFVSALDPTDIRTYQHYGREVCRERWESEVLRRYYTMALMILQYFLPLLVLIFTYSRIACKVWGCGAVTSPRHNHLQNHHQVTGTGDVTRSLLRRSTGDHSPAKMIRMTLTVVMVYSLCWLPFNVLMVILDFVNTSKLWKHTPHLWFALHWLAMSHACYNPIILCWMNTKFRQGYLQVLSHLLPCCSPRLSQYQLQLRHSSGLQRAHTYSSAFGSTRGASRTNRSSVGERCGQNGREVSLTEGRGELCCLHPHHLHHNHSIQNHHNLFNSIEGESKL